MVSVLHKSLCIFVLFCSVLPFQIFAKSGSTESLNNNSAIYFIENKGQITDQNHNHRKDIDFKLHAGGGLNLFIGSGHMHYMWGVQLSADTDKAEEQSYSKVATYRLDIELEGANINVQPEALEKGTYYERYYTSEVQSAIAYTYGKVIYRNVYPNIDWVLYIKDGGLKYDFIVRPGGHTDDIKIKYNGANNIAMKNGALHITTPYGSITEHAPYTYQSYIHTPIESSYVLEDNTMRFDIEAYNGQIVIDPSLEWATYMGGSSQEYSYGIASDTGKNIYIVGRSESQSANVATTGAFQDTLTNSFDGFIVKYAPGGARQWGTYYGGNGSDAINSITVNSDNDIIFAGVADTSYNLYVPSAHQAGHGGGNSDVFFGKMNGAGQLSWASYYGGSGSEKNLGFDFQVSIRCDAADNIYMAGVTSSDTGIATTGTAQTTRGGLLDAFLAKFNKNGVRQWGTYYGGTYDDAFNNVNADGNGFVYVSGDFKSAGMGTSGTFSQNRISTNNTTNNNNRDNDIFVGKFNPNTGARIWGTYYGGNATGSGEDVARGIVVADSSNIYVSGSTVNQSGIATTGVQQTTHGDVGQSFLVFDALLLKLDSNGTRKWCTYLGGVGVDHGGNVVLDNLGYPNMTARVASSTNVATIDGYKNAKPSSDFDAAFVIFDKGGTKTYGSYYGNNGTGDYGYGIATAGNGHIYFCGNTESTANIWLSGHQASLGGSSDAFLAKFTPDTSSFIFQPFTQTLHCQGDSFVLNYGVTAPFRAGNSFTVQLSNSSGSFSNPINIGSKSSAAAGTMKVGIPSNVSGTGFRIRIVSTTPADTSNDNGININIKTLPTKPVATNNGPVCSNDTLKLNSTPYVNGVTYNWTGPGSYNETSTTSANAIRTVMNSTMSGDYIVVADLNGCLQSDTTTATIIQAATKPDLVTNAPLCSGDDLALISNNTKQGDSAVFSGPGAWSSTFAGPIISTNTPNATRNSVAISHAGDYYVTVWMNGCQSKDTVNVSIGTQPSPVNLNTNSPICASDSLTMSGGSSTVGVAYNVYGPNGLTKYNVALPYKIGGLVSSNSGNYILEADLAGCRVRDTANVTILKSPGKPNIFVLKMPNCTGDSLILEAQNLDTPVNKLWTGPLGFSDTSSILIRANFQSNMNGDYYLSNTFSNGCSDRDTITINAKPRIALSVTPVIRPGILVCPGADLEFDITENHSINNYQYFWKEDIAVPTWSDTGKPSKRLNIKKADAGRYYVKVISRTNECEYADDTIRLSVVDTISPPVLNIQSSYCANDTINIVPIHPYLNSFTLNYPGGNMGPSSSFSLSGGLTKPKHEGRYIIGVDAGGNCTAFDTGVVTEIKPNPLKPSSATIPNLCDGDELKLSTSSTTGGVSYRWEGPSGYTSSSQNPTISSVIKSVHEGYFLAYSVLNGCSSYPDSVEVVILENPAPSVADAEFCEGGQMLLQVTNTTTGIEYNWTSINNNGFNSTGPNAVLNNVQLSDGGGYILTAREDQTGCIGSDTAYVTIVPLPGKMTTSYNNPICEGEDLTLSTTDTSTGVNYAWTGPGGFTFFEKDATRNEIQLNQTGLYLIRATRGNCSRTDSVQVQVLPTPEKPELTNNGPIASGEDLELKISNPTAGASFAWTGPNNYGSRIQNPTISRATPDQSGIYTLVTTLDGCTSSSITIVTVSSDGADGEKIILYPNPNNGNFTVTANLAYDQVMPYEVISASGRIVKKGEIISVDQKMEEKVEINGVLSSGVYFFRIVMSGQTREIPFTIVR